MAAPRPSAPQHAHDIDYYMAIHIYIYIYVYTHTSIISQGKEDQAIAKKVLNSGWLSLLYDPVRLSSAIATNTNISSILN